MFLVSRTKKLATLLAVPTNYVILKMAPVPYIIGMLYNNVSNNCTVHTSYVIQQSCHCHMYHICNIGATKHVHTGCMIQ